MVRGLGKGYPHRGFPRWAVAGVSILFLLALGLPGWAVNRPPAVAGAFYPADPTELSALVERLLREASPTATIASSAQLVGLIVPHAGYPFSGATAALGFKSLLGQTFARIFLLGVDHHSGLSTVSIWNEGAFETPLGPVPVDSDLAGKLLKEGPPLAIDPAQHLREHSIEVLLPFYQSMFKRQPMVPISVGGPPANGLLLGKALAHILKNTTGRTLILVSSDWSHYHNATEAATLDQCGIRHVLELDSEGLLQSAGSESTELCGLNGVLALTWLMRQASGTALLLERTDSAKGSGDTDRVVGYAAILFSAPDLGFPGLGSSSSGSSSQATGMSITSQEIVSMTSKDQDFHQEALQAVRQTLESFLKTGTTPELSLKSPRFQERCGVFVTLKKHGELRGCIGFIQGVKPLAKAIQEMAIAAATEDPRFPPVDAAELKEIRLEISVLTPMVSVKDLSEIQVGRDGLLLRQGYRSGVLLPQVPTEYGWDRDTFLLHLCDKAGLPAGSHLRPDAQLLKFSAEVFHEAE